MSKIEVNTVEPQCGTTLTLGACGQTVALGSGASQTGFGRTGTVDWQTSDIKTGTFTAADGKGYFINTTSGSVTVNLPVGSAGTIVSFSDYARTWDTNKVIVAPNGSEKIGGGTAGNSAGLSTAGQSVTFLYQDSTQGWINIQDSTSAVQGPGDYVVATGGTPDAGATSGDYKIHTFTGPGTLTVTCAGPVTGGIDYMVVAGGGGGGGSFPSYYSGGGGGAGGFRESVPSPAAWTASPIANPGNARTVTVQGYPIVVGGGGAGGTGSGTGPAITNGTAGSNSSFDTISSAGGGYGGRTGGNANDACGGGDGGSGGGGGATNPSGPANAGGSGNTPVTSPAQGFDGGAGSSPATPASEGSGVGAGGGGATAVGGTATPGYGEPGGAGATTCISASPVAYAIGGASGTQPGGTPTTPVNSGIGGQAGGHCSVNGALGGSGVVIVRYKFQN